MSKKFWGIQEAIEMKNSRMKVASDKDAKHSMSVEMLAVFC
jgi:hypothetical protein